jgi:hypothetical protein
MIAPDPDVINDVAPQAHWHYELLEPTGEAKFRIDSTRGQSYGSSGNWEHFHP